MWHPGDKLKFNIFEEAEKLGNISEICRKYNISRTKYYYYKRKYKNEKKRNEFLRNPSKNFNFFFGLESNIFLIGISIKSVRLFLLPI